MRSKSSFVEEEGLGRKVRSTYTYTLNWASSQVVLGSQRAQWDYLICQ